MHELIQLKPVLHCPASSVNYNDNKQQIYLIFEQVLRFFNRNFTRKLLVFLYLLLLPFYCPMSFSYNDQFPFVINKAHIDLHVQLYMLGVPQIFGQAEYSAE